MGLRLQAHQEGENMKKYLIIAALMAVTVQSAPNPSTGFVWSPQPYRQRVFSTCKADTTHDEMTWPADSVKVNGRTFKASDSIIIYNTIISWICQ